MIVRLFQTINPEDVLRRELGITKEEAVSMLSLLHGLQFSAKKFDVLAVVKL